MMSEATLTDVLAFLDVSRIDHLDLTGGAPELNPGFRRLVSGARELGVHVIDRCNLTILEEPDQRDLARFLAREGVEIIASLPCYTEELVDRQRGKGVYETSIRALKRLNALGYGSELQLNLVYNPQGPVLPPAQEKLEADYKRILGEQHGIVFNRLYVLANMPIQRFGSTLVSKGQFQQYMALLHGAYRAENLGSVMCRTLISVDWQGYLYDCDFNQMLGLPLKLEADYKRILGEQHGIVFNRLYVLANMPIQRFGSTLVSKGQFQQYMALLHGAYRAENLGSVMCRTLISVDWQGYLYDCDFNQMLGLPLKLEGRKRSHLSELIGRDVAGNPIAVRDHCYACTAGQGSSCGGALHG